MHGAAHLLFLIAGTMSRGSDNSIHLISVSPENSSNGSSDRYAFTISAEREIHGNIVLMESSDGNENNWKDRGSVLDKTIASAPVNIYMNERLLDDRYYCIRLDGDDHNSYYSEAFHKSRGVFFPAPGVSLKDKRGKSVKTSSRSSSEDGSVFHKHKAVIITFISVGTVALLLGGCFIIWH